MKMILIYDCTGTTNLFLTATYHCRTLCKIWFSIYISPSIGFCRGIHNSIVCFMNCLFTLFGHTSTCKSYLRFCECFVHLVWQVPFHLSTCRNGMNWLHVVWKWHHVYNMGLWNQLFSQQTKPFSGQCGSERNHHFSKKCHKNKSGKYGLNKVLVWRWPSPSCQRTDPFRIGPYCIGHPWILVCFWQGYFLY